MFITQTKKNNQMGAVGCGLCKKETVNDEGLGDEEYRGQTKTGQVVVPIVAQVSEMFGTATGTGLIVKMLPKGVVKTLGIDMNPASLLLAPMTFGASLLPGVSKLLGEGFKVFGGMFKKATHMGDCMKWWSDSNIRGMVSGIVPYAFDFHRYMMLNFPQFLRQYQIKQADGTWASVGVDSLLDMGNRRVRIANIFVRIVRQNADIMTLQCAVQHSGETGYTGHSQAQVSEIWNQIKEVARQEEYSTIAEEVDRLVAPFKVKETWGAIVKSRATASLIPMGTEAQLRLPENIIGVKRGAFVMTLKTPQGQPTK